MGRPPCVLALFALALAPLPVSAASESLQKLSDALAHHESFKVRATAAVALGRLGEPEAVAPLGRALLHDGHFAVRAAAASAIGRLGSSDGVEPLLAALSDDDPFVQKEVLQALERHHQPAHLLAFERGLEAENAPVRLAAVRAFGAVLREGHDAAAEQVMTALADDDPAVKEAAEGALDRIAHERALPLLQAGLSAGDSAVRAAAARMLARRTDPSNLPHLVAALSRLGEGEGVRTEVRASLRAHAEYLDLSAARREARGEAGPEARALALRLLAAVGDAEAPALLKTALADVSRDVRTAAARGAADLGTPEAKQMLQLALRSEADPRVKRHIELVLRTMR